jgi:hypothetical protein
VLFGSFVESFSLVFVIITYLVTTGTFIISCVTYGEIAASMQVQDQSETIHKAATVLKKTRGMKSRR